jgi:UDP-glucuronate 4-epimerase
VKILVTGAAGFIGSHVLRSLKNLNLEVLGIDNFSSYYSTDYKILRLKSLDISLGKDVVECDIVNHNQIEEKVSSFKPDYIIHLAAQAGVRLGLADSNTYVLANVLGFQNIIRSSIESEVKGIVYASSSSVYGDSTPTPFKESSNLLRPKSLYGVTKLSNELFAEIQSKSHDLRFRGLRYFTVYGPWGRPDMAYFRVAAAALGQGAFTLFGDGLIKRDFTYIDDVVGNTVALLFDLAERDVKFNDIVNIGGGRPLEMNYLIELISKNGDFSPDIDKADASKLDSQTTMADNSYLKSILGELNFTDLERGVGNLMVWARNEEITQNLLKWIQSTV